MEENKRLKAEQERKKREQALKEHEQDKMMRQLMKRKRPGEVPLVIEHAAGRDLVERAEKEVSVDEYIRQVVGEQYSVWQDGQRVAPGTKVGDLAMDEGLAVVQAAVY